MPTNSNVVPFTTLGPVDTIPPLLDTGHLLHIYGNQFAVRGQPYTFFVQSTNWELEDAPLEGDKYIWVSYYKTCGTRVDIVKGVQMLACDTDVVGPDPDGRHYYTVTLPSDQSIDSVRAFAIDYSLVDDALEDGLPVISLKGDDLVDIDNLPDIFPPWTEMHKYFTNAETCDVAITDMDDSATVPDDDILGASIGGVSTWYTNRAAAQDWHIYGIGPLPSDMSVFDIAVDGTTYDMLTHANASINVSTGAWSFEVPGGVPATEDEYDVVIDVIATQGGTVCIGSAAAKYVVWRTAPTFTASWGPKSGAKGGGLAEGDFDDNPGNPAFPGEYMRWDYDATGTSYFRRVAVQEQSGDFLLGGTGNFTNFPTHTDSFRRINNVSVANKTLRLIAEDWAGNTTTVDIILELQAKTACPTVTLTITSGNEAPDHLVPGDTISGDLSLTAAVIECRNSGNDDTFGGITDGVAPDALQVNESYVQDIDGSTAFSDTVSIPNQSEGVGLQVRPQVRDQYYQDCYGAEVGDFAFNPNDDDESSIINPELPFNSKSVEEFGDESSINSTTNATVIGDRIRWDAATGTVDLTIATPGNGDQIFKPRPLNTSHQKITHSAHGANLKFQIWDGGAWLDQTSGDDFGDNAFFSIATLNSAASINVRIQALTGSAPDIDALQIDFKS